MLSKTSTEYTRILSYIDPGRATKQYSIPRQWANVDESSAEFRDAVYRVKSLIMRLRELEVSEQEIARQANSFLNLVEFATAKPRNSFFIGEENTFARGFFIVSLNRITKDDITTTNGAMTVYMYGGCCEQRRRHYHYVFVLDYDTRLKDIKVRGMQAGVNMMGMNITVVGVSTVACERYIRSQLVSSYIPYKYTRQGYDGNMIRWFNPDPTIPKDRISDKIKVTNYVWRGGVLTNKHARNESEKIFIDNIGDDRMPAQIPFSPFDQFIAEYIETNDKVEGMLRGRLRDQYNGQPVIRVFSRKHTHMTIVQAIINDARYRPAIYVYTV